MGGWERKTGGGGPLYTLYRVARPKTIPIIAYNRGNRRQRQ